MSAGTLDDRYLKWLYGQVSNAKIRKGSKTYWKLLRQMYTTEFIHFVPNDENRAEDGKELRLDWTRESGVRPDRAWLSLECSFLELILGLAKRLNFQEERTLVHWFWHLLKNLGFESLDDSDGYPTAFVEMRMRVVNERSYDADGNGGLFPLRNPTQDQRKVDLWYQMMEYLVQDM